MNNPSTIASTSPAVRENLAETLAREMKQPVDMTADTNNPIRRIALPPGWKFQEFNDDSRAEKPFRKTAMARADDADSFIDYLDRHSEPPTTTVWCNADFVNGAVDFLGIINDHGCGSSDADWRDHRVVFRPRKSVEWTTWTTSKTTHLSQVEFAAFIENNLRDVASQDGSPSGAQMLEMALSFEANQDMRFKSALRLQSGAVDMAFVKDDDNQTVEKMRMFDRFSIGIPVFWNSDPYRMDARLRYRVNDGKLKFWYELIRPEKVLEAATKTLIEHIRTKTGLPFFFGNPG